MRLAFQSFEKQNQRYHGNSLSWSSIAKGKVEKNKNKKTFYLLEALEVVVDETRVPVVLLSHDADEG